MPAFSCIKANKGIYLNFLNLVKRYNYMPLITHFENYNQVVTTTKKNKVNMLTRYSFIEAISCLALSNKQDSY
ncbi:hypothetical protein HanPSC8_Chr17g0774991 [Helianthus annuus]|nr:hypothetical protein HanPSC8_Chr17g0774991 [Helianthus annuus]